MLRPYLFSLHAGAPHHRRARARLHALAARRLAVPGSARVSGAAREIARSQAPRRGERGASRAGLGRWNEAGGLVFEGGGPPPPFTALLWFYGNGETVAAMWPIVREFQPPGTAVLVLDYPGYGGSGGRATEGALYAAADAAYATLAARPDVDPQRIYVYGRSLGSAVATYTAAHHPVAGLILESPFTNAAAMAKYHYGLLPRFLLRLSLDNVANVRRVSCPILLFHGDADRLVPTAMGMAVAAAATGPVEVVLIHGAGHNDTYDVGGRSYRDKMWQFIGRTVP